jgi:hypothetical protein
MNNNINNINSSNSSSNVLSDTFNLTEKELFALLTQHTDLRIGILKHVIIHQKDKRSQKYICNIINTNLFAYLHFVEVDDKHLSHYEPGNIIQCKIKSLHFIIEDNNRISYSITLTNKKQYLTNYADYHNNETKEHPKRYTHFDTLACSSDFEDASSPLVSPNPYNNHHKLQYQLMNESTVEESKINFANVTYETCIENLKHKNDFAYMIRPSFKGKNHLTLTYKATSMIFYHIDIALQTMHNDDAYMFIVDGNNAYTSLQDVVDVYYKGITKHLNNAMQHKKFTLNYSIVDFRQRLIEQKMQDKGKKIFTNTYRNSFNFANNSNDDPYKEKRCSNKSKFDIYKNTTQIYGLPGGIKREIPVRSRMNKFNEKAINMKMQSDFSSKVECLPGSMTREVKDKYVLHKKMVSDGGVNKESNEERNEFRKSRKNAVYGRNAYETGDKDNEVRQGRRTIVPNGVRDQFRSQFALG